MGEGGSVPPASASTSQQPLPLRIKLAYGAPSFATACCLALSTAGAWLTYREDSNLAAEPGILAVFGVLVGGFAFTGCCYHLFRLRAAIQLWNNPVNPSQLQAHIRFNKLAKGQRAGKGAPRHLDRGAHGEVS